MVIRPFDEPGGSRTIAIKTSYNQICEILGFEPNVEDDPDKVKASWGFKSSDGRLGFIWCYQISKDRCRDWSADGDVSLLEELFGTDRVSSIRR